MRSLMGANLVVFQTEDGEAMWSVYPAPNDPRRRVYVESVSSCGIAQFRGVSFSDEPDFVCQVNLSAPLHAIAEAILMALEHVHGTFADAAYCSIGQISPRDAAEQAAGDALDWSVDPELKPFPISIDVTAPLRPSGFGFDADEELTLRVDGRWLVARPLYIEQIEAVQIAVCQVSLN